MNGYSKLFGLKNYLPDDGYVTNYLKQINFFKRSVTKKLPFFNKNFTSFVVNLLFKKKLSDLEKMRS